jgi:hypothetical protein
VKPMMKCGHAANATDSKGNPVCVICIGIDPGAEIVDESPPNLEGRTARCVYCSCEEPSSPNLPFFEYNPKGEKDTFYCGCRGWD